MCEEDADNGEQQPTPGIDYIVTREQLDLLDLNRTLAKVASVECFDVNRCVTDLDRERPDGQRMPGGCAYRGLTAPPLFAGPLSRSPLDFILLIGSLLFTPRHFFSRVSVFLMRAFRLDFDLLLIFSP